MDCRKVGQLILTLRKEKNMTQKELGDSLNISDKTISKWERGHGCPDVTLLGDLSRVLGVNIEKLLLGNLEKKDADGGNMRKIKFYVCKECGNVITATSDSEVSCCGRKLEALTPRLEDEEHKVKIEEIDSEYYITMKHPMSKAHYISFVAYVGFDRVLVVKLYPEQNAELRLPRLQRGKLYVYCTEHGLIERKM